MLLSFRFSQACFSPRNLIDRLGLLQQIHWGRVYWQINGQELNQNRIEVNLSNSKDKITWISDIEPDKCTILREELNLYLKSLISEGTGH